MFRKFVYVALVVILASPVVWAGEEGHDMEAMMKTMENCMICKNMAPHMGTFMQNWKMEMVDLNNGFAIVTTISDPEVLKTYHNTCTMMSEAGAKTMEMSEEDTKSKLCHMCQGIHGFVAAGGSFSTGNTATGDMMIFASNDEKMEEHMAQMKGYWSGILSQH